MSSDSPVPSHLPEFEKIPAPAILREMFDRADIGMAIADIATRRFLRVNRKLCEITGYPEKELLNTTTFAITHPDDREHDRDTFERFVRGETERRLIEKRYVRRDGTIVWVHITTTIIQFGDMRCSFGITEDITERKAAFEALETAERRKNHFLATLAHELRNPLAAIRNSSALLRRVSYQDDAFDRVREIIERQSKNLEHLVDDLLDSARITAGKITLDKTYVGVSAVINEAVETIQHQLAARGHRLAVALPSAATSVFGDKLRLVQIFVNLLTNAIKYTPPGGRIEVDTSADARDVTVAVTDTGIGIAPEELPHIFNLFEQVGEPRENSAGGLGIGLAITRRLIELHGGTISVRSHPGLGTTFKVMLPRMDRRVQSSTKQAPVSQSRARILLVEDNADVADTMAMVLREQGHEVNIAPSAKTALVLVDRWTPDVFLIDLGLPDVHGYELVKDLRAKDTTGSAFMVAVSGHAQQSDVHRSLEAGFDKHLVKPVDFETLNALLAADRRQK